MTVRASFWAVIGLAAVFLLTVVAEGLFQQRVDAANLPLKCVQMPALTGDATSSAGSCAVTGRRHLISTQTASASTSLAWTALGAVYHKYHLSCYGLFPTTTTQNIFLQYGEGATPTWEVASYSYSVIALGSNSTTAVNVVGTSAAGISISGGTMPNTAVSGVNLDGYLSDILSTTQNKSFVWTSYSQNTNVYVQNGSGAYLGDLNAITSVRVVAGPTPGTSTIAGGTCSLYAMVQT